MRVRSLRSGANAVRVPVYEKLARVFTEYLPATLVIREPREHADSRKVTELDKILETIKTEAREHEVPVPLITRKAIKTAFSDLRRPTKHEIASALANSFPELRWKLPPSASLGKAKTTA